MRLLYDFSEKLVHQLEKEDEESDDDEDSIEEQTSPNKAITTDVKRSRESKTVDNLTENMYTIEEVKQKFYASIEGGIDKLMRERRMYIDGLKGKVVQLNTQNMSPREIQLCNILRSEDEYSILLTDLIERLVDPSLALASGANVSINTIGNVGTSRKSKIWYQRKDTKCISSCSDHCSVKCIEANPYIEQRITKDPYQRYSS